MRSPSLVPVRLVACLLLAAPGVPAQEQTAEERLFEILRAKGILDAAEHEELQGLASRMRDEIRAELLREQAMESEVARSVEELIPDPDDEPPKTDYRVGRGFRWSTPDRRFRLRLGVRLQVRFTYHQNEVNDDTFDEDEPEFTVPRARVWLEGNAFERWLRYKVQVDVAGDEAETSVTFLNNQTEVLDSNNELSELKDAWFEVAKWDAIRIRAGQFKVPYSRQFLTSSGELQFVDRAITDKIFVPGRDIGLMVHGRLGGEDDELFEYRAGVFNGDGENRRNDDKGLMWVVRLAVSPLGGVGYTESDTDHTEDFRFSVGVNGWLHQDDDHLDRGDDWAVGGDVAAFWRGFSLVFELHYREDDRTGAADVKILGWMGQIGYFVVRNELEIAVRASELDYDDNGSQDSARREYLVVLGWFLQDHALKIQLDFGRVERHEGNHADNEDEWRIRLQFQMIF